MLLPHLLYTNMKAKRLLIGRVGSILRFRLKLLDYGYLL
jgi:hypothetical protein